MSIRFDPRSGAQSLASAWERLFAPRWVKVALFLAVFLAAWLWDRPVAR